MRHKNAILTGFREVEEIRVLRTDSFTGEGVW
jgi:hypothetical protein